MGLFKKTPEEIAEREAKKREEAERQEVERQEAEKRRLAEEFAKTPAGMARATRASGARTFQISLPLSQTIGHTVAMTGAYTTTKNTQHASIIDSVEAEGWRLEYAGYVYRVTGSVSRDKFLASGQQEAVHGEIVGVYIFRTTETSVTQ
jgi:DUF4097 and DUF4098 domain-containing protein YvlB